MTGGSFTGNVAVDGGGIGAFASVDGHSGSIIGVTITDNVAQVAGGVINTGADPAAISLQIAKVIANTATSGAIEPDVSGANFTFL